MGKKLTLGKNAGIFHDAATKITIKKGEVVELNNFQLQARSVKAALQGGHLVIAPEPEEEKETAKKSEEDPAEALKEKFVNLASKSASVKTISKSFSLEELKQIATKFDLEVEDSDTKESLIEAIIEENK